MVQNDVPSPIDLRDRTDAREWERTAMQRPFREEFFAAFAAGMAAHRRPDLEILELGSGPGFLAEYVLSRMSGVTYTLLDFSAAMHELARLRLRAVTGNTIRYVERSYKDSTWTEGIRPVDVVATNQAVHELRHKRHAPEFFLRVRKVLKPEGVLLFCDHYHGDDGMSNDQLYMNRAEQLQALESAGFCASEILVKGGRALYRAQPGDLPR